MKNKTNQPGGCGAPAAQEKQSQPGSCGAPAALPGPTLTSDGKRLIEFDAVTQGTIDLELTGQRARLALALLTEAERYTNLAKDLSFQLLREPYAHDVEKKKRQAQDHLIRAETYRAAARNVEGKQ